LTVLGQVGTPDDIPAMLEAFDAPVVSRDAHWALASMGNRALPWLQAAAGRPTGTARDERESHIAVEALVEMGEAGNDALKNAAPRSIEVLLDGLDRHHGEIAYATAVRRLAGREVSSRLLAALHRPSEHERAIKMLISIASVPESGSNQSPLELGEAVPLLLDEVRNACGVLAPAAVHALGVLRDPAAVEALEGVLVNRVKCGDSQEENSHLEGAAADALGEIGDRRAVNRLVKTLSAWGLDSTVRSAAARALKRIGDPRGLRALSAWEYEVTTRIPSTRRLILASSLVLLLPLTLLLPPVGRWYERLRVVYRVGAAACGLAVAGQLARFYDQPWVGRASRELGGFLLAVVVVAVAALPWWQLLKTSEGGRILREVTRGAWFLLGTSLGMVVLWFVALLWGISHSFRP
jgi:HEAT repeat protein